MRKSNFIFACLFLALSSCNSVVGEPSSNSFILAITDGKDYETSDVFTSYDTFKSSDFAKIKSDADTEYSQSLFQPEYFENKDLVVYPFTAYESSDAIIAGIETDQATKKVSVLIKAWIGTNLAFESDTAPDESSYIAFCELDKSEDLAESFTVEGNVDSEVYGSFSVSYPITEEPDQSLYVFRSDEDFAAFTDGKAAFQDSNVASVNYDLASKNKPEGSLVGALRIHSNTDKVYVSFSEDENSLSADLVDTTSSSSFDTITYFYVPDDLQFEKVAINTYNNPGAGESASENYEATLEDNGYEYELTPAD